MSLVIATDHGLCLCGCGDRTRIAKKTRTKPGQFKGQSIPYINGHNRRKAIRYVVEDRGYRTPCWIWQLSTTIWGYGTEQSKAAHRVMYERHKGKIPKGLQLDHKCRQKDCIRPDRLEPVTGAVNVQRGRLAKLTPYGVTQIVYLAHTSGLTRCDIAEIQGVSPATVFAILRGRIWSNVTGISKP